MKTKFLISILLIVSLNQGHAIGFPHGYSKKKTNEPIEITKKGGKIDKKVSNFKNAIAIIVETFVDLRK